MSSWRELGQGVADYGISLFTGKSVFAVASVLALLGSYWSQAPELWRVLGVLAPGLFLLDLATGIARSVLAERQRISSQGLGRSLVKAYVYLSLFVLCVALDWSVRTGYAAQLALLVFITAREAKSNLENLSGLAGLSGVEIPGFIARGFERLTSQAEAEEGSMYEDRH